MRRLRALPTAGFPVRSTMTPLRPDARMAATSLPRSVRAVALLEAAKGVLVLAAGFGLLAFVHRDLQNLAERLIAHAHLNPAAHTPRIFVEAAARLDDLRLSVVAAGAAGYAALRIAEAYGLWHGRPWALWLGAASAAIYVPFELAALAARVDVLSVTALVVNLAVVALLARPLWKARRTQDGRGP
jgi:uncharacterized membrane protein (DUF2068 family)